MSIHRGLVCICIPNMKFLSLSLCQGEVCTDDDNNANTNDDGQGQSMIVKGSLVDKQNEPKKVKIIKAIPFTSFVLMKNEHSLKSCGKATFLISLKILNVA